jgi:hypothetical protein
MGEKSKAAAVREYSIEHESGAKTRVREVRFIDPAKPDVLHLHRELWLPVLATRIQLDIGK